MHQNDIYLKHQNDIKLINQNDIKLMHQNDIKLKQQNNVKLKHQNDIKLKHQNNINLMHQNDIHFNHSKIILKFQETFFIVSLFRIIFFYCKYNYQCINKIKQSVLISFLMNLICKYSEFF